MPSNISYFSSSPATAAPEAASPKEESPPKKEVSKNKQQNNEAFDINMQHVVTQMHDEVEALESSVGELPAPEPEASPMLEAIRSAGARIRYSTRMSGFISPTVIAQANLQQGELGVLRFEEYENVSFLEQSKQFLFNVIWSILHESELAFHYRISPETFQRFIKEAYYSYEKRCADFHSFARAAQNTALTWRMLRGA